MRTITCYRCGHTFDTAATQRPRCPSCHFPLSLSKATGDRTAQPTGGSPIQYVLALGCGHIQGYLPATYPSERVFELQWSCGTCTWMGAPAAIVATLSPTQAAALTSEDHLALIARGKDMLATLGITFES